MTTKTVPQFSVDWLEEKHRYWKKYIKRFKKHPTRVLEIGVFEGKSVVYFLENVLLHPDSKLVAIDTFEGSVEFKRSLGDVLEGLQERFLANVAATGKGDQVRTIPADSFTGLLQLHAEKCTPFDVIYVDGSHMACDVLADAVLSWPLLGSKGIMIFDDYKWEACAEPYRRPKPAIDAFLECFSNQLELLHSKYQVIVRKK